MHSSGDGCRNPSAALIASMWVSGAGAGIRLGVSISRYPRPIKNARTAWIIAARTRRHGSLAVNLRFATISFLFLDPGDIFPGPRIDGQFFTLFDKRGHPHAVTGLKGYKLVVACSGIAFDPRSEEHTSELQSRLHLVCRLLLEKNNGIENKHQNRILQGVSSCGQFRRASA